jgi:predicted nucleic acid-binding protein
LKVVDASVAIKWFLPEENGELAERLKENRYRLCAPDLMKVEVANALWKKVRKGEISERECQMIVGALTDGAVQFVPDGDLFVAAFQLACRLDHPVYDCLYLVLAEAERGRVVTADMRLVDKARSAGMGDFILGLAEV